MASFGRTSYPTPCRRPVTSLEVSQWFEGGVEISWRIPVAGEVLELANLVNNELKNGDLQFQEIYGKLGDITTSLKNAGERLFDLFDEIEYNATKANVEKNWPEPHELILAIEEFLTRCPRRPRNRPRGRHWHELAPIWAVEVRKVLMAIGWPATTSLSGKNATVPRVVAKMIKAATDSSANAETVAKHLRSAQAKRHIVSLV